jgi:hypothetical protein
MSTSKNKNADSAGYDIEKSKLMDFFEDALRDVYWAEKALVPAMLNMADNATSDELLLVLNAHLKETEDQIKKVEMVFELIGREASTKKRRHERAHPGSRRNYLRNGGRTYPGCGHHRSSTENRTL